jgi:hypothetical protein
MNIKQQSGHTLALKFLFVFSEQKKDFKKALYYINHMRRVGWGEGRTPFILKAYFLHNAQVMQVA